MNKFKITEEQFRVIEENDGRRVKLPDGRSALIKQVCEIRLADPQETYFVGVDLHNSDSAIGEADEDATAIVIEVLAQESTAESD